MMDTAAPDVYGPDEILGDESFIQDMQELQEEQEYPFVTDYNVVGDTEVFHFGTAHTEETYWEFNELYGEAVSEADAVAMETPIGEQFYENGHWNPSFFQLIGDDAASESKPVYDTDPRTPGTSYGDDSLGALTITQVFEETADLLTENLNEPNVELLNWLGSANFNAPEAMIGAYIFAGTTAGSVIRTEIETSLRDNVGYGSTEAENPWACDYGWKERLQYSEVDWSNVMMADNTEHIARNEDLESLVTFQGAGHTEKISGYMEERKFRKLKKGFYAPLNIIVGEEAKPKKFDKRSESPRRWEKEVLRNDNKQIDKILKALER